MGDLIKRAGGIGNIDQYGQYKGNTGFVSAASGGNWMVNGSPGQDTNLVNMALSQGELVSVTPARESQKITKNDQPIVVNMVVHTPDINSFKQGRSAIANRVAAIVATATRNRAA